MTLLLAALLAWPAAAEEGRDEAALRDGPALSAFDASCAKLSAGTGRHDLRLLKSLDVWGGEEPLRLYAVESRCEAFERSFSDPASLFALGPWGVLRLGPLCGAGACRAFAGDPVEVSTGPAKAFVLTRLYDDAAASSREVYLVRSDTAAWRSWTLPQDKALGRGAAGSGQLQYAHYFGLLDGGYALAVQAHAFDASRLPTPLELDLRWRGSVPLEGGFPSWRRARYRFMGGTSTLLADARAYSDPSSAEPAFALPSGRRVRLLQRKRAGGAPWWNVYDEDQGACWVRASAVYSNPKLVPEELLEGMDYPEPEFESDTVWREEGGRVFCSGRTGRKELPAASAPDVEKRVLSEDGRRMMLLRRSGVRPRLELWDARACAEQWRSAPAERVLGEARAGYDLGLTYFLLVHPSAGQRPFRAVLYDELGRPAWDLGEYDLVYDLMVSPNGRYALLHQQLRIGTELKQFITKADLRSRSVETLPADAFSHPVVTDAGEVVDR